MKQLLINSILIVSLLIGGYVLSQYAEPVRSSIQTTKTAVAGAHTSVGAENTLPKELQKDITHHIESVKKDALNVSLADVFSFFSRAGKIINDLHSLQEDVQEKINSQEKENE